MAHAREGGLTMQRGRRRLSQDNKGYLFIAPYFILFAIFSLYPVLYTLRLSFTTWDGLGEPIFVGFKNYQRLIQDTVFLKAIVNTVWISVVAIVFQMIFGVGLAFLLNQPHIKCRGALKTIFYFPNLVTAVSLGILFNLLFDWQGGSVNRLLMALQLIGEPVNWKMSAQFAQGIISFILWFQYFGYYIILFTAGINGISEEVLEAASIDGANRFQQLTRIVLPLLKPILTYASITSIIGGMQIFDLNFVLGGMMGDPNYSTMSMVLYMYTTSFTNYNYGYGAAISYGLFMLIIAFSVIYLRMTLKKEERL